MKDSVITRWSASRPAVESTIFAVAGFLSSAAYGTTVLPPAAFSNGLGAGEYNTVGPNSSYVDVGQYYAGGKGWLDVTGSDGTTDSVSPAQYSVYLSYSVEISGPSNTTVPVDLALTGYASVPTVGDNYALVSATFDGFTAQACAGFPGNTSCPHAPSQSLPGLNNPYHLSVPSNTVLFFTMLAEGQVTNLAGPQGPFNAFIDPSVTIDPSFTTPGYNVLYSADLGAPPVPLPATAWLLLSGLCGLGIFLRRPAPGGTGELDERGHYVVGFAGS